MGLTPYGLPGSMERVQRTADYTYGTVLYILADHSDHLCTMQFPHCYTGQTYLWKVSGIGKIKTENAHLLANVKQMRYNACERQVNEYGTESCEF